MDNRWAFWGSVNPNRTIFLADLSFSHSMNAVTFSAESLSRCIIHISTAISNTERLIMATVWKCLQSVSVNNNSTLRTARL